MVVIGPLPCSAADEMDGGKGGMVKCTLCTFFFVAEFRQYEKYEKFTSVGNYFYFRENICT